MIPEPENKEESKGPLEQLTSDPPPPLKVEEEPKPKSESKPKPKTKSKSEPVPTVPPRMPRPSNAVLKKLAEIVTHVEVLVEPGLNAFNKDHVRTLLKDFAMLEWVKEMEKLKMIPDNARK